MIYKNPSSPDQNKNAVSVEISCSIEGNLDKIYLIFSIDNGHSWYRAKMNKNANNYTVVLPNITRGVKILYLFKAIGLNGEEYIENNNGRYYSQIAGKGYVQSKPTTPDTEKQLETQVTAPKPIEQKKPILKKPEIPKIPETKVSNQKNQPQQAMPPEFSQDRNVNPFLTDSQKTQQITPKKIYSNKKPEISSDQTIKLDSTEKTTPLVKKVEKQDKKPPTKKNNGIPITAYNPFPVDYGDVQIQAIAINSFSKIIDEKLDLPPTKNDRGNQKPIFLNSKSCTKCDALLDKLWKICPICGTRKEK